MRLRIPLLLVAVLVFVLAACGDDDPVAADNTDPAADAVEVDISMQDMEFVPDQVEVPAGATVTFNLDNDDSIEHDLVFEDGTDSGRVAPGDSATLEAGGFTEDTVGWCDVPGHRAAGMELEVIVID